MQNKLKYLIVSSLLFLAFLMILVPAKAQNEINDYNYQYEQYTKSYVDFIKAKDEYASYLTLTSKEKMENALRLLLMQRAETQRSYFLLIRKRLRDNPGLLVSEKNQYSSYLTEQIIFLDKHRQLISNMTEYKLQDLLDLSKEVESRSVEYHWKGYKILSLLILGEVRDMQIDALSLNSLFDQEIKAKGGDQKDFFLFWVEESANQALISENKLDETMDLIDLFKERMKNEEVLVNFRNIKALLEDSQKAVNQAYLFQSELLEKIEEK